MDFKKKKQKITKEFLLHEFKMYAPLGAGNKGLDLLVGSLVDRAKRVPIKFMEHLNNPEKLHNMQAYLGVLDGLNKGEFEAAKLLQELQAAAYMPHVEEDAHLLAARRIIEKLEAVFAVKYKHVIQILEQQELISPTTHRYPANVYEFYKFLDFVFDALEEVPQEIEEKPAKPQKPAKLHRPVTGQEFTAPTTPQDQTAEATEQHLDI